MATYLAFLRAVNVGGRKVPMATLRELLGANGFTAVETHIQTGNVRLGSDAADGAALEADLERLLGETFGFEVATLVRTPAELATLVEQTPASPRGDGARHYVSFLRAVPSTEAAARIDGWDREGESMAIVGRDVHIWLDKPSHEAKAGNALIEQITKASATNRNWTVVAALAEKWC